MGPTWVLSAPDGPHVGPMNLAIREFNCTCVSKRARGLIYDLFYTELRFIIYLRFFLSGMVFPAVCLVAVSFLGCHQVGVVSLLVVGTGMSAITHAGFMTNYQDIAPVFAGKYRIFWT